LPEIKSTPLPPTARRRERSAGRQTAARDADRAAAREE
jgi:ATP-dependent RNA helicase SUPV3L1/SUV3